MRSTSAWASGLGASSPLERPSWLTAEPAMIAMIGSPSRRASERRFSTSMPPPSDRLYPLASCEKDLIRPSGASTPPTSSKPTVTTGVMSALTPPATTTSASPERRAFTP
ncbi:Uncharacterised protein [Mycobacteroides abscessus subsp. abscessus]|nr:Uncharacterised protein [Mycobacteroides abscessus subsp. abscessus]